MFSFSSIVLIALIVMNSGALSMHMGPSALETTAARVPPESSAIDRDTLDDKFHILASQIKAKIEMENNIPIFEFGKDMATAVDLAQTSQVDSTASLFKLELLYNEYMGKLRDYYLNHFRRSSGIDEPMGSGHKEKDLEKYKEKSLAECEKAMKSATLDQMTHKVTWKYDVR
jgi:hypothetical protein